MITCSCILCCSAIILGAGKFSLEPMLSREEAVASEHRDQPHDLRPLPYTHKAEHWQTQGKETYVNVFLRCLLDGCWCSLSFVCSLHLYDVALHLSNAIVLVAVVQLLLVDKVCVPDQWYQLLFMLADNASFLR